MNTLLIICFTLFSLPMDLRVDEVVANDKYFVVAGMDQKINQETKTLLMNAIQAEYKVNPQNVTVDIIQYDKKTWLVFDLSKEKLSSVSYELKEMNKQLILNGSSAKNTCAGQDCSFCSFKKGLGCECNTSSGSCDHTVSKKRNQRRSKFY